MGKLDLLREVNIKGFQQFLLHLIDAHGAVNLIRNNFTTKPAWSHDNRNLFDFLIDLIFLQVFGIDRYS